MYFADGKQKRKMVRKRPTIKNMSTRSLILKKDVLGYTQLILECLDCGPVLQKIGFRDEA